MPTQHSAAGRRADAPGVVEAVPGGLPARPRPACMRPNPLTALG